MVQWLHFACEVATFTQSDVVFLLDSVYQKLLKSIHFSPSYFKKSNCVVHAMWANDMKIQKETHS